MTQIYKERNHDKSDEHLMQIVHFYDSYKSLIIVLKHKTKYEDMFHVLFSSVAIIIERLNIKDFAIIKKMN